VILIGAEAKLLTLLSFEPFLSSARESLAYWLVDIL
jgi:hypothetical protein